MWSIKNYKEGEIASQFTDPETGFKGLIRRGSFSFCAYIGVPVNHFIAGMDEYDLDLPVHGGITFSAYGKEIEGWSVDWYWVGWDYAHFMDALDYPSEVQSIMRQHGLGQRRGEKEWDVPEITQEILDAMMQLRERIYAVNTVIAGFAVDNPPGRGDNP